MMGHEAIAVVGNPAMVVHNVALPQGTIIETTEKVEFGTDSLQHPSKYLWEW